MPTVPRSPARLLVLAVALAGLALPMAADARVPQGFYGVMWDRAATQAPADEQEAQWSLMAQSGVESVRTVFSWASAQRLPGIPTNFEATDRLVEMASRHNIKLVPVVLGTPTWAAQLPGEAGSPPAKVEDYTAYLQQLVLRYGPAGSFWDHRPDLTRRPLREWQIWNEPHLGVYWNTKGRDDNAWAPEYAALLRASKRAIEDIDPGATIVLAGLADFSWKHLARLFRHRIRRQFDVAAFNLFTGRPRNVLTGVRLFRRALRRGGMRRTPIWLTETTWPAGKGRVPRPKPAWQRAWYTTDEGMASRLRAVYSLAARNRKRFGLERLFWYTWASAYRDGDLFDYAGLVRYADGVFEARPALEAYAASARRHQGCAKAPDGTCLPD
jgi:hypothetical protein